LEGFAETKKREFFFHFFTMMMGSRKSRAKPRPHPLKESKLMTRNLRIVFDDPDATDSSEDESNQSTRIRRSIIDIPMPSVVSAVLSQNSCSEKPKIVTRKKKTCLSPQAQTKKKVIPSTTTAAATTRSRGLTFFLVDLPAYGKHFDQCLASEHLTRSGVAGFGCFRRSVSIPKLFKGLMRRVFHDTGELRVDPDLYSIQAIRQLCTAVKKLRIECPDSSTWEHVNEFFKIDSASVAIS
jgi:hypothetical protein